LNKNIGLALLAAASIAAFAFFGTSRPDPDKDLPVYRIAVSDDAAGLLISKVSETSAGLLRVSDLSSETGVSFLRLADCCGVQAELFLARGEFDMAVLCPDAAKAFVENDPSFEISGGIVKRSNVILHKPGRTLKNIGYTNGKNTQAEAALHDLGGEIVLIPMMRTALPYALERGAADGVVVDILDALKAAAPKAAMPKAAASKAKSDFETKLLDYEKPTSVLVVKKNLRNSETFKDFINILNRCVSELNGSGMEAALRGHIREEDTGAMMEIWKSLRVTYIGIPNEG
jgi:hypothetical protein